MIGQLCRYKEGKKKRDMVHNALHSHASSYNELHYFVPYYWLFAFHSSPPNSCKFATITGQSWNHLLCAWHCTCWFYHMHKWNPSPPLTTSFKQYLIKIFDMFKIYMRTITSYIRCIFTFGSCYRFQLFLPVPNVIIYFYKSFHFPLKLIFNFFIFFV